MKLTENQKLATHLTALNEHAERLRKQRLALDLKWGALQRDIGRTKWKLARAEVEVTSLEARKEA